MSKGIDYNKVARQSEQLQSFIDTLQAVLTHDSNSEGMEDSRLGFFETFDPARLFEYENWGGKYRSGGRTTRRGEIGSLDVKGADQMDQECFVTHDVAVYNAEHREMIFDPQNKEVINRIKVEHDALVAKANADLCQCLQNLPQDPRQWNPAAQDPGRAISARDFGIWIFRQDDIK